MEGTDKARDRFGMDAKDNGGPGPAPRGADSAMGRDVCNEAVEPPGDVLKFNTDRASGQAADAVLSYRGS